MWTLDDMQQRSLQLKQKNQFRIPLELTRLLDCHYYKPNSDGNLLFKKNSKRNMKSTKNLRSGQELWEFWTLSWTKHALVSFHLFVVSSTVPILLGSKNRFFFLEWERQQTLGQKYFFYISKGPDRYNSTVEALQGLSKTEPVTRIWIR